MLYYLNSCINDYFVAALWSPKGSLVSAYGNIASFKRNPNLTFFFFLLLGISLLFLAPLCATLTFVYHDIVESEEKN